MIFSKKHIVIATKSSLLKNSIKENFDDNIIFLDTTYLPFYDKIDLLVVEFEEFEIINFYKVNTLINISNKEKFVNDEIKIPKPFRLSYLLDLIRNTIDSADIFCNIGSDFIYNERSQTLESSEKLIKFTERENEIFKSILLNPNFKITKNLLLKNIWQYHKDTQSLTVDTHLYKLKIKLPDGMLEIKNNNYQLNF